MNVDVNKWSALSAVQIMMQRVVDLAETVEPYAPIVFGSDPPKNGICMIDNGGYPDETYLCKGMLYRMPVLLNGKNADQFLLVGTLQKIHAALTKRTDYAEISNDEIQVVNIATTSAPSIIGREQNNQWICGSSLEITFFWRS